MTTTFRSQTPVLNYSKIRNSRKESKVLLDPQSKELGKVSSTSNLQDLQENSTDSAGKLQALESTMNQENLNYVNTLIRETEKQQGNARPKSITAKPKKPPVKVNIILGGSETPSQPQRLFDNFFRFKNAQDPLLNDSCENQRQGFSGEKLQPESKKQLKNESLSSKETQSTKNHKSTNEFLKSIDEYLSSLTTNEKELGTAYFSQENEKRNVKEIMKENAALKNENRSLRLRVEKFEQKVKEYSNAKRVFMGEYNMLKLKEEESGNLIKFLQQEILKMKSHVESLKFKLKVTQESLAKEKIEAENSMIALKRVLFNNINESRMEEKFKKMFVKNRGKEEFEYSVLKNGDPSKNFNNFIQPSIPNETNESFVGKSIESNVKSSHSQESFDDFSLYKSRKPQYELEKKRRSMHSRYEFNPETAFLGLNPEISFNKKKQFPEKLTRKKYQFYNDSQFEENLSSMNDIGVNSSSVQNE